MEEKIIFDIKTEDKRRLQEIARVRGLALASFCRFVLLREIKGDENGTTNSE